MDISQILAQAMGGNMGSIRPGMSPISAASSIPGPVMAPGQQMPRPMPAPPPVQMPQQQGADPMASGMGILGSGLGKLLAPQNPPMANLPQGSMNVGDSVLNTLPIQQFTQQPGLLQSLLTGLGGFLGH